MQCVLSQCPNVLMMSSFNLGISMYVGKRKNVCGGSIGPFTSHVPKAGKIRFLWSTVKMTGVSYKCLNLKSSENHCKMSHSEWKGTSSPSGLPLNINTRVVNSDENKIFSAKMLEKPRRERGKAFSLGRVCLLILKNFLRGHWLMSGF